MGTLQDQFVFYIIMVVLLIYINMWIHLNFMTMILFWPKFTMYSFMATLLHITQLMDP